VESTDPGRRLRLLLRANISHHQTPEQDHGHWSQSRRYHSEHVTWSSPWSRDQDPGHHQQASGAKLSRTEMNVLQTMIAVIVVFLLCWTVTATANILQLLGVSIYRKHIIVPRISCFVGSRASSCYELWSVTISTVCDKALKVTRRSAPWMRHSQLKLDSQSVSQSFRGWQLRSVSQRDVRDVNSEKHVFVVRCQSLHVVPGRRGRCAESGRFSCYVVNTAVTWEERWSGGTALPPVLGTSRRVVMLSSVSFVDCQWSCCVRRWFSNRLRRRRRRLCLGLLDTYFAAVGLRLIFLYVDVVCPLWCPR